tara:strand:+ start:827 stop:1537 length:711 start_codon:yes stop_codon:yes gene_type:complete
VEVYNEKILIIDNEIETGQLLKRRLTNLGYNVILTLTVNDALVSFTRECFDLVIIDIILPKLDGYEICRKIRNTSKVPIILLSALGSIQNRIMGLDLGADDYIIKPFSPKELEARIRSVLRRCTIHHTPARKRKKNLEIGNLVINLNKRFVFKNNLEIKLTSIESNVLELLVNNAGKELSRTMILDNVWGYTPQRIVDTRIVDVHISRLRLKIEENPSDPDLIITVRGIGYVFLNS